MISVKSTLTESNISARVKCSNGIELIWSDSLGYGYLKSNGYNYGDSYWENYRALGETEVGKKLTDYRVEFVKTASHFGPEVFDNLIDIGIGSGQFVDKSGCKGYDVNPQAIKWLNSIGKFVDPYAGPTISAKKMLNVSMWDVLEHIDDPTDLLIRCSQVFTSMPIHKNLGELLNSKHLKPDEHIWHFTDTGIKRFMNFYGFTCNYQGYGEIRAGRESIGSYHFSKNKLD